MKVEVANVDSPVGPLLLAVKDGTLCALEFSDGQAKLEGRLTRWFPTARPTRGPAADRIALKLSRYFSGRLDELDSIPADAPGTAFQRRVWAALRRIPVGRTASYQDIASAIGNPAAVRAVGMANARNPIALVIPCHRVIAADGSLCGYGGGRWRKEWLLSHEEAIMPPGASPRRPRPERAPTTAAP